jgi:hypothetical protein
MRYNPQQQYQFVSFEQVLENPLWLPKPTSLLSFFKKKDAEEPKIVVKTLLCESFQENPQGDFSEYHFKDFDGMSWHNQFPRISGSREDYEWPVFPRPDGNNHYVVYFDLMEHVQQLTRRRQSPDFLSDLLNEENERFTRYRKELLSKVSVG